MILKDETHVLMSQEDFDNLPSYYLSLPTSPGIGFMWKSRLKEITFNHEKIFYIIGEVLPGCKFKWRELIIV